jgi:hypothetical protein
MLEYRSTTIDPCPVCGGSPTLIPTLWGNVFYAMCSECSWEGDTRNTEISSRAAMEHWTSKVLEYNNYIGKI